jgi:hypothetical protein
MDFLEMIVNYFWKFEFAVLVNGEEKFLVGGATPYQFLNNPRIALIPTF